MIRCGALAAALAAVTSIAVGCGNADRRAASQPAHEHEPNDGSATANGPVGPAGIILHTNRDGDEDFVYFKLRPNRRVSIAVKHLSGACGETFFETALPGPPGPDNGGQDQTALRPDAPIVDENGNRDTGIGNAPGTVSRLTTMIPLGPQPSDPASGSFPAPVPAATYRRGILLGYLSGDTRGCRVIVRASPASALISERSAGDAAVLRDLDLTQIGAG